MTGGASGHWMGDWVESTSASRGAEDTWGPYWDAMFPPRRVRAWINWKRMSTGVNIAKRLWDQREYLRRTYESVHGADPAEWPSQHPGVVLDAVLWVAHGACLGCHWFDPTGHSMRRTDDLQQALVLARRHETSNGAFRGGDDRMMPSARAILSPPPAETPPLPRRAGPIPPLRIADRYAAGRRGRGRAIRRRPSTPESPTRGDDS